MSRPHSNVASGTIGPIRPPGRHARAATHTDDASEIYDDEVDHTRCCDCKGSGWYVGFTERRYCPTCDGSGYL